MDCSELSLGTPITLVSGSTICEFKFNLLYPVLHLTPTRLPHDSELPVIFVDCLTMTSPRLRMF